MFLRLYLNANYAINIINAFLFRFCSFKCIFGTVNLMVICIKVVIVCFSYNFSLFFCWFVGCYTCCLHDICMPRLLFLLSSWNHILQWYKYESGYGSWHFLTGCFVFPLNKGESVILFFIIRFQFLSNLFGKPTLIDIITMMNLVMAIYQFVCEYIKCWQYVKSWIAIVWKWESYFLF